MSRIYDRAVAVIKRKYKTQTLFQSLVLTWFNMIAQNYMAKKKTESEVQLVSSKVSFKVMTQYCMRKL